MNALKAETTPECFVLDGGYTLRYRGRIDDSYYERLKKHPRATRQDLRQVLGELLSGRPVSVPATRAVGCPITRADKPATKPATVTYYRDVAPLIQNHCQQCHRPGEVGPFSLMSYKQAVNWADDIKKYTQDGLMPPWKAVAGPAFHNDRRLSPRDIDTLAAWVDGGTPAGDPKTRRHRGISPKAGNSAPQTSSSPPRKISLSGRPAAINFAASFCPRI